MIPCTTTPHSIIPNGCHITGECEKCLIQPLPVSFFNAYLRKNCERETWVYQHITFGDNLQTIVVSLQRGDLRAVCDCSFDDGYGSDAWCIDGDRTIIRGANIVPVGSYTLDETQCELVGI